MIADRLPAVLLGLMLFGIVASACGSPHQPTADAPGPETPRNATCATAQAIRIGESFSNLRTPSALGVVQPCTLARASVGSAALWFRTSVPPRKTLGVHASNSGQPVTAVSSPRIRIYRGCAATDCSAISQTFEASSAARTDTYWTNGGDSTEDVLISINHDNPEETVALGLGIDQSTPPDNAVCSRAAESRGILREQLLTAHAELQPPCLGESPSFIAPSVFYTAVVGAGMSLAATALSPLSLVVRIIPECGSAMCLGSPLAGMPFTAVYANDGPTDRRVVIAVGQQYPREGARGEVYFQTQPRAVNTTCETAISAGRMGRFDAQSLGEAMAPAPWCRDGHDGNALYYRVHLEPGETLSASVVPHGFLISTPPRLRLASHCGSTVCLRSTNCGADGCTTDNLTYENSTATAQDLILSVDSGASSRSVFFELITNVTSSP